MELIPAGALRFLAAHPASDVEQGRGGAERRGRDRRDRRARPRHRERKPRAAQAASSEAQTAGADDGNPTRRKHPRQPPTATGDRAERRERRNRREHRAHPGIHGDPRASRAARPPRTPPKPPQSRHRRWRPAKRRERSQGATSASTPPVAAPRGLAGGHRPAPDRADLRVVLPAARARGGADDVSGDGSQRDVAQGRAHAAADRGNGARAARHDHRPQRDRSRRIGARAGHLGDAIPGQGTARGLAEAGAAARVRPRRRC